MNTAASENVIDRIVNSTSAAPSRAACSRVFPISKWRTMFSSMTMASSTTNPTASVRAIRERLSRLYCNRYITENVPMMDIGSAKLGMIVAVRLRRNRKITSTTSASVSSSVEVTSWTAASIEVDRSYSVATWTAGGISRCTRASAARTRWATATVFVPG